MIATDLFPGPLWRQVRRTDPRARRLADRHYSRQTIGAQEFTPPGRVLVLLTACERAVWATVQHLDPRGNPMWRCSLFRNESTHLSSELVAEATETTFAYWRSRYGAVPSLPLRTEVDPGRTRPKRDPGRCFLRAGWTVASTTRDGLVIFHAPRAKNDRL